MNTILNDQNSDRSLQLLSAQMSAYSRAKGLGWLDVTALLAGIASPIVATTSDEILSIQILIGIVWSVIYIYLDRYRSNYIELGAKLQERFDIALYRIEWNAYCSGNSINEDIIQIWRNDLLNDKLRDWYTKEISENLPHEIAVTLCQRENLSWDNSLRNLFVKSLFAVVGVYGIVLLLIGWWWNFAFREWVATIAPSIPLILLYATSINSNIKAIQNRRSLMQILDKILIDYRVDQNLPTKYDLRSAQDQIYSLRTLSHQVPDWFQNWKRRNNEERQRLITKELK